MSRAERRRAERAARKQAGFDKVLEAKHARIARRIAREPRDPRPLILRVAKFFWDGLMYAEHRDFWRLAGFMSWIGWAMGIDTRDRRLPAWTGLNQDPGTPASPDQPTPRRRAR